MINPGMVNGGGFHFLPAAKCAFFFVFTRKNGFLKVR
jgi:hypothetical protein